MTGGVEAAPDGRSLAKALADVVGRLDIGNVNLMEVCGTHTMAIAKGGIRSILPEGVRLVSGPGCPVCVTSNRDIDTAIALARLSGVTIATFGDMVRVPGSSTSLQALRGEGADVEVVYSPLDALEMAAARPGQQVVFIGVGFETTAPAVAATIKAARARGIGNFSVFCAHKTVPHVLEALVNDPEVSIDAFILPGHVSTIIGMRPYDFLASRHRIPGVITGFETADVLKGIAMLLRQLAEGRAEIENAYGRGVAQEGNPVAVACMDEVFEECDAVWRGLGAIPSSGYRIRAEFAEFDAMARFGGAIEVEETVEPPGCRCPDVLRGIIRPDECPLFGTACSPQRPVGPCMVSTEGSCAAHYRYRPQP